MTTVSRPGLDVIDILVVEDDPGDILLTREALIVRDKRLPAAGFARKPVDLFSLVATISHTAGLGIAVVRRRG